MRKNKKIIFMMKRFIVATVETCLICSCLFMIETYQMKEQKTTECSTNLKETREVYGPMEKINVASKVIKTTELQKAAEVETEVETELETETINTEPETQTETESYDNESLYWLSHIINAEEESGSYENKLACGSVVMNRVKDESYPNTIEEVIFQTKFGVQYESAINGRIWLEPNEDSVKAAKEILNGNYELPSDVVFQAEFEQGSGTYAKIENEYYCFK